MVKQITLMEAYLIEALKGAGIADEVILEKVRSQDLHEMTEGFEARLDFDLLYGIEEKLSSVLRDGYQVKFLTFPGLQRLLEMKLDKKETDDYIVDGFTVKGLRLTEEEGQVVRTFLANNWNMEQVADSSYTIQPK